MTGRGLAASALVLAVLSAAPTAAQPAPDGTLGIRLADGSDRYLVASVHPGEVLRRRVEVSNATAERLSVSLYAAAASASGPSGFDFADGRTTNELTGWTAVRPSTVSVGPGRSAVASVEVRVPTGAAPGARYAVVWAEQSSAEQGLALVSRVGVRMYVDVQEPERIALPAAGAAALLLAAALGWLRQSRRTH